VKFLELSGGRLINVEQIVQATDITGTGYYRLFMHNGTKVDLGPEDSEALKRILIPPKGRPAKTTDKATAKTTAKTTAKSNGKST
jgi:hypothetical protein